MSAALASTSEALPSQLLSTVASAQSSAAPGKAAFDASSQSAGEESAAR